MKKTIYSLRLGVSNGKLRSSKTRSTSYLASTLLTAFLLSLTLCFKKYLLESFLCKKLLHFSCQEFMVASCIYITR